MIRHLARNFNRLCLKQASFQDKKPPLLQRWNVTTTTSTTCSFHAESNILKENISEKSKPNATSSPLLEPDSEECFVSYQPEQESLIKTNVFLQALESRYRLSSEEAKRILSDENLHRLKRNKANLLQTLDALTVEGVSRRSLLEYTWLLSMDKARLSTKLNEIKKILYRDINHFVPFLRLSITRIRKLVTSIKSESNIVPYGNRLYYISELLRIDPNIVAKYLSKRLFIFDMPFEMFEQNLKLMVSYNVPSMNILKDLWAFRYTPKSVQLRLERAKRAKKDKIMPWMVRCTEPILQRSLQLTLDEQAVLGEKQSTAEYIAERLQFTVEETKVIMDKHPQVYTVRVTKIKEVLDYLLDEAGFDRYEIAQVPRILCHSLETTKQRLEELKKLDCRPSSLVILCRSKREYEKFVSIWQKHYREKDKEGTQEDTKDDLNSNVSDR